MMVDNLTTRPMFSADVEAVLEIESACFPLSAWKRQTSFIPYIEQTCGKIAMVVCTSSGTVAGYYLAEHMPLYLLLTKMAVHPSYHRKGIGKFILANVASNGREHSEKAVELRVRASNKAATRLYLDAGYQKVECVKGYYARSGISEEEKTAIIMRLEITESG